MWVRLALCALCLGFALRAQMRMTTEQLISFVKSSAQLNHDDKRVAEYLRKVKLVNRLDDRTIEDMQGMGAGPRTLAVLHELRDATKDLPPPPPPAPKPQAPVIPPPSAEEQREVLQSVREYALGYSKSLPNFICTQVTRRFIDPSGMEFWQRQDVITARLTYFEQKEDYKTILVNNRMTDMAYERLGGATSYGEFGSMLKQIFEPETRADFAWDRWVTLRGRRMHVFSYRVLKAHSKWLISYERTDEYVPGYRGFIYVDRDTRSVMRVTLDAVDIPPSFPIQMASTRLDYDNTKIGESEFILPLMAVVRMRQGKFLIKNEVEFRLYRRFGAEATITFDTPEPLSEDKTKEQPIKP